MTPHRTSKRGSYRIDRAFAGIGRIALASGTTNKRLYETYNTTVRIEARTLETVLRTRVLPAALRYQGELARIVTVTKTAGLTAARTEQQLQHLVELVEELREAVDAASEAEARDFGGTESHACQVRDELIPAMERARRVSDELEGILPDDLWPLPTYAEMLFVR